MEKIKIRTLEEVEIPTGNKIFRLGFGIFIGFFDPLLVSWEYLTIKQGLNRLIAGVNTSHEQAYKMALLQFYYELHLYTFCQKHETSVET
ncbi:MAG: hypothetical protein AAFW70_10915 [Cyanobacteria bacterium J06635_10]